MTSYPNRGATGGRGNRSDDPKVSITFSLPVSYKKKSREVKYIIGRDGIAGAQDLNDLLQCVIDNILQGYNIQFVSDGNAGGGGAGGVGGGVSVKPLTVKEILRAIPIAIHNQNTSLEDYVSLMEGLQKYARIMNQNYYDVQKRSMFRRSNENNNNDKDKVPPVEVSPD